jgi:multiple sugar transport system permease protein
MTAPTLNSTDGTAPATRAGKPRKAKRSLKKQRYSMGTWGIWALLVIGAAVVAFPFYWMFVTSVTPGGQATSNEFYLWPEAFTCSNYQEAFTRLPMAQWITNSLTIAVIETVLSVFVSMLAGYAFAKFKFRGRTMIFFLYLLTIMVPIQVTLVPSFLVIVKLGLVDSIWGVILPGATEATAVFIARQFMLSLPQELMEAARMDGLGELKIFFRIVVPLSGPLIGVLAILAFMGRWNEFLWPMMVLQGESSQTLPVGLASLQGGEAFASPWGTILAVATISIIPVLVMFLIFQRQFVRGIASTGLK